MHPVEQERQEKLQKAKAKLEALKGFYSHLFFFVVINIGIFLVNYLTTPDLWWFYWPLLGWSVGLLAHFMAVIVMPRLFGPKWEERQLKKIMESDR